MLYLDVIMQHDSRYQQVWQFAHDVYRTDPKIAVDVAHRPPVFLAVFDETGVNSCIGLNMEMKSDAFTKDFRFKKYVRRNPDALFVDQSFCVFSGVRAAREMLLIAIGAYAAIAGIHKIVYAGRQTFCTLLRKLGLQVDVLGPVQLSNTSANTRAMMQNWEKHHKPYTCILDTESAWNNLHLHLEHHLGKLSLSQKLASMFFDAPYPVEEKVSA